MKTLLELVLAFYLINFITSGSSYQVPVAWHGKNWQRDYDPFKYYGSILSLKRQEEKKHVHPQVNEVENPGKMMNRIRKVSDIDENSPFWQKEMINLLMDMKQNGFDIKEYKANAPPEQGNSPVRFLRVY